jgi:hypothetical protein
MRPRWASLLGGTSVAFLLQYVDLALVSRWNFEDNGTESREVYPIDNALLTNLGKSSKRADVHTERKLVGTFWARLCFGWNSMWAFRRVNTPYGVKNVPPFSSSDLSFVTRKWAVVCQRLANSAACYLTLDLLALRNPPTNTTGVFDPAYIPIISRIGDVSLLEFKRKALMITGFACTFYCIVQGAQSLAAAVAVASALSEVESWRPAFGSLSDAYSFKKCLGVSAHALARTYPKVIPLPC